MSSIDYEADLTEEERAIQATAHRFAEEVMRPWAPRSTLWRIPRT